MYKTWLETLNAQSFLCLTLLKLYVGLIPHRAKFIPKYMPRPIFPENYYSCYINALKQKRFLAVLIRQGLLLKSVNLSYV